MASLIIFVSEKGLGGQYTCKKGKKRGIKSARRRGRKGELNLQGEGHEEGN